MSKVKYGTIKSNHLQQYGAARPIAASQTFESKSGRFVKRDGSGNIQAVAGNSEEELLGAVDFVGDSGSSAGDTEAPVQINPYVPVEMPVYDGAVDASVSESDIESLIQTSAAINVSGDTQYVDISDTTDINQVLVIVGGDADENTLYAIQNVGLVTETESNTV